MRRLFKKSNEGPLYLGFAVVLVLFLTVGTTSAQSLTNLIHIMTEIIHMYDFNSEVDQLMLSMTNLETGQRGYVITGKDSYLEPYYQNIPKVHDHIQSLRDLASVQSMQKSDLDEIENLTNLKIKELQSILDLQKSVGQTAAVKKISTDVGKNYMDEIRLKLQKLKDSEISRLSEARNQATVRVRNTLVNFSITCTFAFLVLTVCFFLFKKNNKKSYVTERLLKKSETLFQYVFEFAPDAMISADNKGIITGANSKISEIFGWNKDEIIGKPVEVLVPPKYRSKHVGMRDQFIIRPSNRPMGRRGQDLFGLRKDDTEFPVAISLGSFNIQNELFILAVIRDVTEQKRHENLINDLNAQLSEKVGDLEAINHELESFSYSVSHDLRAPLRAMSGFSNILLEDFGQVLPAQAKAYLDRITQASLKMGSLIDGILELSRLSRKDLVRESINLSEMFKEITQELQKAFPDQKVDTHILPTPKILGDRTLLKTALYNLVENAWKFSAKTNLAMIEFGTLANEKNSFYIKDNGCGFDMKYVDKLFGTFQRLHSDSDYKGTGIGLATVRRIISRHGGRIWVDSALNKGTTFYFTLPTQEANHG